MSSDDIVTRLRRITARPLGLVIDPPPHPLCKEAADEIMRLRAEVDRLRAERDDHKQRLAVEAFTAPDADFDTMMDSLQARLRELHAEVERLRDENAAFRAQFAFADEIREAFANWDGTDASLPEGWRREW